jgi:hypothetical protein
VNPFLVFFCFLAGMVIVGKVVSKITGSKAYYLESFPLEEGERILWQDMAADAYPIPTRRALIVTYRRARRGAVRVTNRRIIAGTKTLFGANHVVQHVLYPSDRAYPSEANAIGGGLLTRGFQVLVFERLKVVVHASETTPFADLSLDQALSSSLNLERYRIYSDAIQAFCIPE